MKPWLCFLTHFHSRFFGASRALASRRMVLGVLWLKIKFVSGTRSFDFVSPLVSVKLNTRASPCTAELFLDFSSPVAQGAGLAKHLPLFLHPSWIVLCHRRLRDANLENQKRSALTCATISTRGYPEACLQSEEAAGIKYGSGKREEFID